MLTPGSLTTVPVKPALASKINWVQIFGTLAMLGSFFGLDISGEQQAAVITTIGVAQSVITFVMRTWFTKSIVAGST